jgi:AcrR family transcriptional regulator
MKPVAIKLNEKLFLRDPQETKLGRKIISHGIEEIDHLGFEKFTFKKLSTAIGSTEASIYRYFENKHKFLLYLVSWYWESIRCQIIDRIQGVDAPAQKLRLSIQMITEASQLNTEIDFVNEQILHRIVVSEAIKAYHSKEVDAENREGLFANYKSLVRLISEIIREIEPQFPYPHTLAASVIEMANENIYYAEHLPSLTDLKIKEGSLHDIQKMLEFFAFKMLNLDHLLDEKNL